MPRPTNLWIWIIVALVMIGGVTPVRAQDESVPSLLKQSLPGDPFDVEFKGGTAAEYVEAVRQASKVQVVAMPGCEDYRMPALELRGVRERGALEPLKYAEPINPRGNGIALAVQQSPDGTVFVIAPERPIGMSAAQERVQPFSLAVIVQSGRVGAEDALTAVETALEMTGDGRVAIKYHPETQLLMVRGTPEALATVDRVLDGIAESAQSMNAGAREHDHMRQEIAAIEAALVAAQKEAEEAEKFAVEWEKSAAEGKIDRAEALAAKEKHIEAERRRDELAAKLKIMQARSEAAETKVKAALERREAEEKEKARQKSRAQPVGR